MNDLNEVLIQILDRIKKNRSIYEQNEMAVRNQIVNPILRSLGWDPENPSDIQHNVSTEEGIPDYSLIKDGKTILFLEAKKMSVDVERREVFRQLAYYSFEEGKGYGVITNGIVWMLIKSFEEGTKLPERIIWKMDLENEELSKAIRKITTISKDDIEQIEILVNKINILEEIWQSLLDNPEGMITGLSLVVESIISQKYSDYQFENSEIEDLLKEKVKELISGQFDRKTATDKPIEPIQKLIKTSKRVKLKKMQLNGESYDLNDNFEVLVNTANWLIKNGKLKLSNCPITVAGMHSRYLINREPKHPKGNEFRAPKELSSGLWIETHYKKADCILYSQRLLEKFGFLPNILTSA